MKIMKKSKMILLVIWLSIVVAVSGCSAEAMEGLESTKSALEEATTVEESSQDKMDDEDIQEDSSEDNAQNQDASKKEDIVDEDSDTLKNTSEDKNIDSDVKASKKEFTIPKYNGKAYATINNNVPTFKDSELKKTSYETYSALDNLGRCGVARANIGKDLMPTDERGSIGNVKPSGWHTVKYDIVDGKYLYNRCHLIGFQLTGENANVKNLITGTRYMNVDGMLPFENMVADYIKETGKHVLYQVKPIFEGNNLVATGVHIQAKSVEDKGKGISFNIFVFNVQPGITIDYATGYSSLDGSKKNNEYNNQSSTDVNDISNINNDDKTNNSNSYVLNTNTKKFHYNSCSSVKTIANKNKDVYKGNRKNLINKGYEACKRCNP